MPPWMTATWSSRISFLANFGKFAMSDCVSYWISSSCLPRRPPFALISATAYSVPAMAGSP